MTAAAKSLVLREAPGALGRPINPMRMRDKLPLRIYAE